jgi:hypothetical protein
MKMKLESFTTYEFKVWDRLMEALDGNRIAQAQVKAEAFSSADFPLAFQRINQMTLQSALETYQPVWPAVGKRVVLDNLKPARSFRLDVDTTNLLNNNGGKPRVPGTLPRIPEGTEYPGFTFTQSEYEYGTAKNGGRISMTWEAFQNDDWGQIAALPNQMLDLATWTEESEVFSQYYVMTGGYNPTLFGTANNLTGNPALTLNSLQAAKAMAVLPPPTPAGGIPRRNTNQRWALLVGTAQEAAADQLLGITQIKSTDANGNEFLTNPNLSGIVRVTVPALPYLAASNSYVQTTGWALVPYGGESYYGETVIGATLRGRETPQLRIKNDQGQALGGGALSPWDGDFDADSIQIRIAQWFKGNAVSNFGMVWSKGNAAAGQVAP